MKKILFFGPVQLNNPKAVGGGEAGNRKTIKLLESFGCKIKVLEKPYITNGALSYALTLLFNIFKIILYSFKGYKNIHITGYYLNSIYFECLVILISKLFGFNIVYELRAGGMIEAYRNRTSIYRFIFKLALKNSNNILCQGLEYKVFNKQVLGIESLYYPNFILKEFLQPLGNLPRNNDTKPSLIYFGRVNEDKNSSFLVEIAKELITQKFEFDLEIIGKYSQDYEKYLCSLIKDYGLGKRVKLFPPQNFNELSERLKTKHFFIFPSKEKREGHSNALTEAMVFGVVPVASNQGFNKTVVNELSLISESFKAKSYAKIIMKVWETNWSILSKKMYDRVEENYTEEKALEILKSIYF